MQGKETIRVIYIMGMGRSGSTLLNIILGNHPEIESFGDLIDLTRFGWLNNELCSCGKNGNDCPFWSRVQHEWVKYASITIEEYLALQNTFEHIRSIPRLCKEKVRKSTKFMLYEDHTLLLFKAIRAVSNKPFIADASKTPGRAFALSLMPEIDLRLIHLVRDARGVAFSKKKPTIPPATPVLVSAVIWVLVNIFSTWVCRQLGAEKARRIRYEDFTDTPEKILNEIGPLSGVDLTDIAAAVSVGESMHIGHIIAGNRIRMDGGVLPRSADREWTGKPSINERCLIKIIAGGLMRYYGFNEK